LTHEINELFGELKKERKHQRHGTNIHEERKGKNHNSDYSDEESGEHSGPAHKTPDTRDLLKQSGVSKRHHNRALSQHQVSQKTQLIHPKVPNNDLYADESRPPRHRESFYSSYKSYGESEIDAAGLDLSKEQRRVAENMFGSDFDIGLVTSRKEETMRILQEKSFRGLFLRLQFWIN